MPFYLGIDVGSTTVKIVLVDEADCLLDQTYRHAHGQPGRVLWQTLQEWSRRWDLQRIAAIGLTGSGGGALAPFLGGLHVNELIAQTHALDRYAPHARTVIEMGGQDSKLLVLEQDSDQGRLFLTDFAMNTLCAAGTGSFLDQQAERLGIPIEEFADLALQSSNPARVAGRCTVFAKSDMIHLQQRGAAIPDVVAGLCLAVARNFRSIIGRGKPFRRPILFQGGVALNAGMVWAFEEVLGLEQGELLVPPHCTLMAALGAAHVARDREEEVPPFRGLAPLAEFLETPREAGAGLPRLRAGAGVVPAGAVVRPAAVNPLPVFLGVDVGSISTKVVALDERGQVLAHCYLRTAGQPLEAVREGLSHVGRQLLGTRSLEGAEHRLRVLGVGVTGSGRRLVGDYIGADLVRNEISAQARAALVFDAEVDTVFEIGGQDSKYVSLNDGVVVDFCMNKACAAGTGSFLEEQAHRLQLPIEQFGSTALEGPSPADLGERCTVFMESDLVHHQQQGACRENLVAGLAYSIARNYLNRVVHDRPVGQRILFLGGVAYNPAVVAAFEHLLARPVVVPPHHEVSGAIGAALLAKEEREQRSPGEQPASPFKGFDLSNRPYHSTSFECQGCPNHCEIQRVTVEGERPSFYGARCERYEEKAPRPSGVSEGAPLPDLFAERESLLLSCCEHPSDGAGQAHPSGRPRVGLPRVLFFYELLPFWTRFFRELGWEVVFSPPTTPEIAARSAEGAGAETCFPVKLVYGHVLSLLEQGVDRVFFPNLINRPGPLSGYEQNYHCPFIQAAPNLASVALEMTGRQVPLLQLPIHLLWNEALEVELRHLSDRLGVSLRELKRAWREAEEQQRVFEQARRRRGEELLADLPEGTYGAVLVGRPYNTADPGVNAGLPLKLRRLGVVPIPIDCLPLDGIETTDLCGNMYWYSGQRILAAGRLIQRDPRLQAIYVTNFGCGPDSFLLSFFREAMQDKPFLELEVDDHSADAGLVTRCEAFFDSLAMRDGRGRREKGASGLAVSHRVGVPAGQLCASVAQREGPWVCGGGPSNPGGSHRLRAGQDRLRVRRNTPSVRPRGAEGSAAGGDGGTARKTYVPYMCDHAYILAAAMRYHRLPAEVLPPSDEETLDIGRSLCLGRECLPCFTCLGDIVRRAGHPGFDPAASAFLMPCTGGPCRFGQYHYLQRHILDRLGLHEMELLSPSAENAYQGFGDSPIKLRRLIWQGIVAVDLLEKLLHEHRPYEQVPGSTEELYGELLQRVIEAIEAGGGRRTVAVMREAARRFGRLPVGEQNGRPIIGLVGEIYLRDNPFINQDIIRWVERLGGEVWIAPMMEWFYYVNYCLHLFTRVTRRHGDRIKVALVDWIQHWDERRLLRPVAPYLRNAHEPPTAELAAMARPYFDPVMGTEAVVSVGKAVDFARRGLSGILNLLPFTCMPGVIVTGLSQRIRKDQRQIPWLDVIYDAQGETNLHTRLEAFLYQAQQFQARGGDGP